MRLWKNSVLGVTAALLALPATARCAETWNGVPDRFQVDAGYFRIGANTVLRFDGGSGAGGDIDFEDDLGLDQGADTFWVDGTWRLGRRHQVKLSYTKIQRDQNAFTLKRDLVWGGDVYSAGLTATSETDSAILGGYYRFAVVRKDRFEIGPALGIGHLQMNAHIRATGQVNGVSQTHDRTGSTGSITGALGGYASGWVTKRLIAQGDFLYIKVSSDESDASVTDWRLGAYYYVFRNAGFGVQYKYDRFRLDRAIAAKELGGEITFDGIQVFASFRF